MLPAGSESRAPRRVGDCLFSQICPPGTATRYCGLEHASPSAISKTCAPGWLAPETGCCRSVEDNHIAIPSAEDEVHSLGDRPQLSFLESDPLRFGSSTKVRGNLPDGLSPANPPEMAAVCRPGRTSLESPDSCSLPLAGLPPIILSATWFLRQPPIPSAENCPYTVSLEPVQRVAQASSAKPASTRLRGRQDQQFG